MRVPSIPPLHAGADPAGVHPWLLLLALSLAAATAVGLYVLLGLLGPGGRRDSAGVGDADRRR
jgi:hypothetical protein